MATLRLTTITSSLRRSSAYTLTHHHHHHHRNPTCVRCCSSRDPEDPEKNKHDVKTEEEKKKMAVATRLFMGAEKVRESLRPKHKGDWKDVALMSLSFAVYIYMSQRIVCAYCAWMDMIHHQGF